MQAFVRDVTGAVVPVDALPDDRVVDVRLRAAHSGAVGAACGRLCLGGSPLPDDDSIADAGLSAECTLTITPSPPASEYEAKIHGPSTVQFTVPGHPAWTSGTFATGSEMRGVRLTAVDPCYRFRGCSGRTTALGFDERALSAQSAAAADVLRELRVLKFISGLKQSEVNIATYSSFRGGDAPCFVGRHTVDTSFDRVCASRSSISVDHISYWTYVVNRGLQWMHNRGIAHGCLCAANVCMNSSETMTLLDAGAADPVFPPPEQLPRGRATAAGDMWAFGMLLVELCLRHDPLRGFRPANIAEGICTIVGPPPPGVAERLAPVWADVSFSGQPRLHRGRLEGERVSVTDEHYERMSQLLQYDPALRPSSAEMDSRVMFGPMHDPADAVPAPGPGEVYEERPVPSETADVIHEIREYAAALAASGPA